MIVCMIGEILEENDDICGAVVSRRKQTDRISLWNRDRSDEDSIMLIGFQSFLVQLRAFVLPLSFSKKIRDLLPSDSTVKISYLAHEDAIQSGQSYYSNPTRFTA